LASFSRAGEVGGQIFGSTGSWAYERIQWEFALDTKTSVAMDAGDAPVNIGQVRTVVDVSTLQGRHYDCLVDLYEAHTADPATQRYRRRFIDEPLLHGIDLDGASVLEAMCGSGHSTGYLLERGARVTGLDISREAVELFRKKWPSAREWSAESSLMTCRPNHSTSRSWSAVYTTCTLMSRKRSPKSGGF